MRVGVLYESDEWSDHHLAAELTSALGYPVVMVDMTREDAIAQALACDALVSRVFASAQFRDHERALERMEALFPQAQALGITLINGAEAHAFEVSKAAATEALANAGVLTPEIYATALPSAINPETLTYPAVIKPDCGGRTTHTCIVRTPAEAAAFLAEAAAIPFVAQRYIHPERGFITRVEIVSGQPRLIVKRSVAANGLSAYRFGSTYELYPDCPAALQEEATCAAEALGFFVGSFDVIETSEGAFFIDANSVSNVSEDCTELFAMDLMGEHAEAIAKRLRMRLPVDPDVSTEPSP